MAVVFGLVQLANRYELDKPENTDILRISYFLTQLLSFIAIYVMYTKISKKNDETKLVYSEPPKPMSGDEPEIITISVKDYDLKQLKQLATQTLIGLGIVSAMHFKWGYLRPLLLQTVLGFRTLYQTPIVKVVLLNFEAVGDLQRPWKSPSSPFGPEEVTPKEQKLKEKKEEKKKIANKKTD
jgi:hypothetical protein